MGDRFLIDRKTKFRYMKNYYKTVYPTSGDLKEIATYLDLVRTTLSFSGYTCYWINESEQNGVKKREKELCMGDWGSLLYVETRHGKNAMDVHISNSPSNQLVVECFYNAWARFFIVFPPLFLLVIILFSGDNTIEELWPALKALLMLLLALKLMVHLFFTRDRKRLMKDLKEFLKEEPIHSESSWKLRL